MGCSAMIAIYPMTGKQVKETCVLNTISLLERIGTTIRESRERHADPVDAVRRATNGYLIWRGKVGDVQRRTETGFARGEAVINGVDEYDGQSLRIAFQNEFLVAQTDTDVLATTPDLILNSSIPANHRSFSPPRAQLKGSSLDMISRRILLIGIGLHDADGS